MNNYISILLLSLKLLRLVVIIKLVCINPKLTKVELETEKLSGIDWQNFH